MSGALSPEEDAFGRQLLDHLAGKAGRMILERDDGYAGPALPVEIFVAGHDQWPDEERQVFEFVHGRVLDVGCGAGRHSLEAQRRGLGTVAIDISPERWRYAAAAAFGMFVFCPSRRSTRAWGCSTRS